MLISAKSLTEFLTQEPGLGGIAQVVVCNTPFTLIKKIHYTATAQYTVKVTVTFDLQNITIHPWFHM